MTTTNTLDATRKEINIGELYGYSTDSNGITEVNIGKVLEVNKEEGKTKLEIVKMHRGLYYDEPEEKEDKKGRKVWVKSLKLFPIK
ncbi:MAG: hypothetical protein ACOC1K_05000 [Nanoarchaeota archaeon]